MQITNEKGRTLDIELSEGNFLLTEKIPLGTDTIWLTPEEVDKIYAFKTQMMSGK